MRDIGRTSCVYDDIGIIILVERLKEFGDFFRRMLKVVVHGYHKLAFGVHHPAKRGLVLPKVPHVLDDLHARIFSSQLLHHVPGLVRAGVVD